MRLLCLLLLAAVSRSVAQSYSIDDVLSAPYCQNLTGAGNRVAWVVNERGVRNLFTATFPGPPQPRQLTHYTTDDGQDLGDVTISPDGQWVAYVRGGGKNGQGVSPNPTSDPAGVEQIIFIVSTNTSNRLINSPIRVGLGSRPVWSPPGREPQRLLFGHGGQLYTVPMAALTNTRIRTEPTALFTARGSQGEYSFSPDGRRVVFTSFRGYHNLIGVYDFGQRKLHWLAPGVDRDQLPVWSPDGRQVAFVRVPGQRHGELENIQGGQPFAIWTASADSLVDGQPAPGTLHWQSPGDDGGFAQYYPAEPLRWTANNRILFFSEYQNWMHVYALNPTRPGPPVDLTPGDAETEETTVSPDGTYLYYSSNLNDTNRRHLWRVHTETGHREALTTTNLGGKGIETDPVLVGQTLVYRAASWNRPTAIAYQPLGM